MSTVGLTIYVLMWPVLATGVLIVLCAGLIKDIRKAKKKGKSLV
ncbi:putative transporter small subunit [Thiopseudomonas alkaliphila]|nr:putative transporter small subunit [Thiopseudomonas alkaliphila]